jgi:hypothetical protein
LTAAIVVNSFTTIGLFLFRDEHDPSAVIIAKFGLVRPGTGLPPVAVR